MPQSKTVEGFAWFWSDNRMFDLIQRSKDFILEVGLGDNVSMKIDKRGYRGPIYAFRPDRSEQTELAKKKRLVGQGPDKLINKADKKFHIQTHNPTTKQWLTGARWLDSIICRGKVAEFQLAKLQRSLD